MTTASNDTMTFYRDNAETYAARDRKPPADRLGAFIARLAPGAAVLDLGCGGGHDSLHLIEAGFDVTPSDGSAELARAAEQRIGRKVEAVTFQEIEWNQRFDAIWAEASLLHVPRTELPDVLVRVLRALRRAACCRRASRRANAKATTASAVTSTTPRPPGCRPASNGRDGLIS